jgi:hypothetical protein
VGTFPLPAGQATSVTISTKDTNGYVVIDAVEFVAVTGDDGVRAVRE